MVYIKIIVLIIYVSFHRYYALYVSKSIIIIEKESVELPVEDVFGESRAWNAIKLNRKIKLTNEHARASRVNNQMSRYSPETYSL